MLILVKVVVPYLVAGAVVPEKPRASIMLQEEHGVHIRLEEEEQLVLQQALGSQEPAATLVVVMAVEEEAAMVPVEVEECLEEAEEVEVRTKAWAALQAAQAP